MGSRRLIWPRLTPSIATLRACASAAPYYLSLSGRKEAAMSNQALFAARAIPQGSSSRTRSALTHVLQTVFDERWVGQQHFTTTEELDALHAAACVGPGAWVLELGSGLGGSAIYLARQQGCHVTGLDASPERVRQAQAA